MRAKDFDRKHFLEHEWPEALESGEFRQGREQLLNEEVGSYCCLGVACELLRRKKLLPLSHFRDETCLPSKAITLLGIDEIGSFKARKGQHHDLATLNDRGNSFKTIAKKIRKLAEIDGFNAMDSDDNDGDEGVEW